MKKLLSLLFVFTLIACGGSDDEDDVNTFLSIYDGIGFYVQDPEQYSSNQDIYIFFSNSDDFLTFQFSGDDCYSLREGIMGYDGGNPTITITSNTEDRLEVLFVFTEGEDEEKKIFTVSGNTLDYISQSINDGGVFEDYQNWTLEKTSFTLTEVCNN